ncbi:CHAT domain-containing protein [Neolewinella persica]|uniref:CHAT domain-containing protein n=1 Tax=Neolewinella persica TaxID=70998 RepID=UPI00036987C0|nr:CHAT domain-containing protein [Neolewinella persica]
MQSTTSREVYERRKYFNACIKGSNYGPGIEHWIDLWERKVSRNLSHLSDAEIWGFRQRLRFIWGDIKSIRADLKKLPKVIKNNSAEVLITQGFVAYDESKFFKAYDLFQRAAKLHKVPIAGFSNYVLMRVHLLSAKCCWRWDDLPKALCHLGMSAHYVMAYHAEQPEEVKYTDYYRGRILSVYPRLLTPRRGPDVGGTNNIELTGQYLEKAKHFFKKSCPLVRKDDTDVMHLFEAEILELEAHAKRNEARRTEDENSSKQLFAEVKDLLKDVSFILKKQYKKKRTRRKSHVLRLKGMLNVTRILKNGRRLNFHPERHKDGKKATKYFTKELKQRKKIFGKKPHTTIARAYNNRALAKILSGNAYKYYPEYRNIDIAIPFWESAQNDAWSAIKANTSNDLTKAGADSFTCLSDAQLITSLNHLMDTTYLISQSKGVFSYDTLKKIRVHYETAKKIEEEYLNKLSSVVSHEDLGRRTHLVYESMLEPCWKLLTEEYVDRISKEQKVEVKKLIVDVFSRAFSPHLYQVIKRAQAQGIAGGARVPYPQDGIALILLEELFNDESETNLGKGELEKLERYLSNKNPGRFAFYQPESDINVICERFNDQPGGAMVHFVGSRFTYVLTFQGDGNRQIVGNSPRLTKLKPLEPFRGVHDLKKLISEVDDYCCQFIQLENANVDAIQKLSGDKEIFTLDKKFKTGLANLYQTLISPILVDGNTVNRYYIVCDKWGWKIPWPALLTQEVKSRRFIKDFYLIKKNLISQQVSIGMLDILENFEKNEKDKGLMLTAFTRKGGQDEDVRIDLIERFQRAFFRVKEGDVAFAQEGDEFSGDHFNFDPDKHTVQDLKEKLKSAHVVVLLGHSTKSSDHKYHLGFLLKSKEGDETHHLVLNQSDILNLNLSKVKITLLLTCKGSVGHSRTGNVPRSFFSAFLAARARNIIYSSKELNETVAVKFTVEFLKQISNNEKFGPAYQNAMASLINNDDLLISHPSQWGVIHFIGDQMESLQP